MRGRSRTTQSLLGKPHERAQLSLTLLLNVIAGCWCEVKCGNAPVKIDVQCLKSYLSLLKSPTPLLSQTGADLRKTANINLTKIEFPFSFINNSFEGKCVCEALGDCSLNKVFILWLQQGSVHEKPEVRLAA